MMKKKIQCQVHDGHLLASYLSATFRLVVHATYPARDMMWMMSKEQNEVKEKTREKKEKKKKTLIENLFATI